MAAFQLAVAVLLALCAEGQAGVLQAKAVSGEPCKAALSAQLHACGSGVSWHGIGTKRSDGEGAAAKNSIEANSGQANAVTIQLDSNDADGSNDDANQAEAVNRAVVERSRWYDAMYSPKSTLCAGNQVCNAALVEKAKAEGWSGVLYPLNSLCSGTTLAATCTETATTTVAADGVLCGNVNVASAAACEAQLTTDATDDSTTKACTYTAAQTLSADLQTTQTCTSGTTLKIGAKDIEGRSEAKCCTPVVTGNCAGNTNFKCVGTGAAGCHTVTALDSKDACEAKAGCVYERDFGQDRVSDFVCGSGTRLISAAAGTARGATPKETCCEGVCPDGCQDAIDGVYSQCEEMEGWEALKTSVKGAVDCSAAGASSTCLPGCSPADRAGPRIALAVAAASGLAMFVCA